MKSRIAIVATAMLLLLALTACEGQPIPAAESEEPTMTTAEATTEATAETAAATPLPAEERASESSEAATDAETAAAAEAIILRPTPTVVQEDPTPAPIAEAVDWTSTASIDGDYYVRGNPNAPIRLIDYSDFL